MLASFISASLYLKRDVSTSKVPLNILFQLLECGGDSAIPFCEVLSYITENQHDSQVQKGAVPSSIDPKDILTATVCDIVSFCCDKSLKEVSIKKCLFRTCV